MKTKIITLLVACCATMSGWAATTYSVSPKTTDCVAIDFVPFAGKTYVTGSIKVTTTVSGSTATFNVSLCSGAAIPSGVKFHLKEQSYLTLPEIAGTPTVVTATTNSSGTSFSFTYPLTHTSGTKNYVVLREGSATVFYTTEVLSITASNSGGGGGSNCDVSGLNTETATAVNYLCNKGVISYVFANENITRGNLAKIAFRGVYSLNNRTVPTSVPSDNYPTIYTDINSAETFEGAKALCYLEYGDGIAPFDRNKSIFNEEGTIERIFVLKVLMETFNIKPSQTSSATFSDPDIIALRANNPALFKYIVTAYNKGIVKVNINDFRPFDNCTRGEAFLMLYRIMKENIEDGYMTDPYPTTADYFEPLNVTIANLAAGIGLELGNFNHYTKTSFDIDGIVPLDFTHSYNSYNAELPDEFFGMYVANQGKVFSYKPLGIGWSHSYHSFITLVNAETSSSDTRLIVHWGGGNIHVYKKSGSNIIPESIGVYDEITYTQSGGTVNTITVKTKGQVEYKFQKLSDAYFDSVYRLTEIKDRNNNTLTINYGYSDGIDNELRIKNVSDGYRSLTFSYQSGTNLISKITDPLGRNIQFNYSSFNTVLGGYLLTSFTDAKGQTTQYTYDTSDAANAGRCRLLTKIQLPKGNYIENEYDANRRLKQSVSGRNGTPKSKTAVTVSSSYTSSSKTMSSSVKNYSNSSSSIDYNYKFNANNNVTEITGNRDYKVNATYSSSSSNPTLPTSVTTNITTIPDIRYDSKGNVTRVTEGTGSTARTTSMSYTTKNDISSVTDPRGNTTYYDYDSKGNLTKVRAPENATTQLEVNTKGLVTKTTNPEGIVTEYDYNTYGNLRTTTIPALNLSSTIYYDAASRVTSVQDFLNRTSSFNYDANDNLLSETDALNHTTNYAYDANDNLTSITNAKGGATSMSYDNTTDLLTSISFGGATKSYTYNDDGTVKTFTKPDGTVLNYTYDDLGRMTNDGVSSYSYDAHYFQLKTISKDGKKLMFSYDDFGRMVGNYYDDFSANRPVYTYDENDNILTVKYIGGQPYIITYTYDALNRMKTVTDWNGKTITYNYLKDSRLSSVSYPNGMTVQYTYDNAGRQTGKTTKRQNGTVIASYSFTLDKAGNIISETRTEPYSNVALSNESVNYTYNSANRITKAGDVNFTVNSNGNITKRGNVNYSYDKLDKLTSDGNFAFEYDGLGNIRSNGINNHRYIMDIAGMGNVTCEVEGVDGNLVAFYIYGATGLEGRVSPNGITTEYYVSDYRGSVVAMVDATTSANITHKYQYDEFGKVLQKEESDVNPFRYVGKYGVMHFSDNLYYMRARFYDPTIGRFLSEDPIWSTNLYPYADNNPIMGIDPEGLDGIDIIQGKGVEIAKIIFKGGKTVYKIIKPMIDESSLDADRLLELDLKLIEDPVKQTVQQNTSQIAGAGGGGVSLWQATKTFGKAAWSIGKSPAPIGAEAASVALLGAAVVYSVGESTVAGINASKSSGDWLTAFMANKDKGYDPIYLAGQLLNGRYKQIKSKW